MTRESYSRRDILSLSMKKGAVPLLQLKGVRPLFRGAVLIFGVLAGLVPAGRAQAPGPARKKLLALGDTHTGFTHDSLGHALAVIDRLGHDSGLYDTYIRTDSQWITKQPVPAPARNSAGGSEGGGGLERRAIM